MRNRRKLSISPTAHNTTSPDQLMLADYTLSSQSNVISHILNTTELPATPQAAQLLSISNILRMLSPIFLAVLWYNYLHQLSDFFATKNKTKKQYRDLIINTLTTIGWTILYVSSVGVICAALAPIAPYLLAAVLGLKTLLGLVKCIENLYYFYQTKNREFLWEAGKELLGVISYTLGLVLTFLLGPKLEQIKNNIDDGFNHYDDGGQEAVYNNLDSLMSTSETFGPVIKTFMSVIFIRVIIDVLHFLHFTYKTNKNTLQELNHFSDTTKAAKNAWKEVSHHPLQAIPMFFKIIGKTISLPFLIFYPIIDWALPKIQKMTARKKEDKTVVRNLAPEETPRKKLGSISQKLSEHTKGNTEESKATTKPLLDNPIIQHKKTANNVRHHSLFSRNPTEQAAITATAKNYDALRFRSASA